MARSRNIKPGFYANDELAECSVWARFIFPGLWMLADREGRLEYRPKKIKGELLRFDNVDVEPLLRELESRNFILIYKAESKTLIQIVTFAKHQNPHSREQHSSLPAPPDKDDSDLDVPPQVDETPENTDLEPDASESRHDLGTALGVMEGGGCRADSGFLIPDSPIPDSGAPPTGGNTTVELALASPKKPANDEDPVVGIFAYWQHRMRSPRSRLDDKRRKIIRAALRNYTPSEVCQAIRGCSLSPWHMGRNDRQRTYNGLQLILRNAEKIDEFIAMNARPPAAHYANRQERITAESASNVDEWLREGEETDDDVVDMEVSHAAH